MQKCLVPISYFSSLIFLFCHFFSLPFFLSIFFLLSFFLNFFPLQKPAFLLVAPCLFSIFYFPFLYSLCLFSSSSLLALIFQFSASFQVFYFLLLFPFLLLFSSFSIPFLLFFCLFSSKSFFLFPFSNFLRKKKSEGIIPESVDIDYFFSEKKKIGGYYSWICWYWLFFHTQNVPKIQVCRPIP